MNENNDRGFHPTLRIKGTKSRALIGKKIVVGVTGSVSAVRIVELCRELIRYGADVYVAMTDDAKNIIHPYTLHYASGHEVIERLVGRIEHIEFLGMDGEADLLLIAPATSNTINKIAGGISDTTITLFANTALGSNIPVAIVPAMHESMYRNPILLENIEKLKKLGITFIGPRIEEGKAKIAKNDEIVLHVEHILSKKVLKGKRVLITSGATVEPIDPIRIITNRASGKTGEELAKECFKEGAKVTVVHKGNIDIIGIDEIYVESAEEMYDAVINELNLKKYDIFISAAAISDYIVNKSNTKISSNKEVILRLKPAKKLIKDVKERFPELIVVGFKAETNLEVKELIDRAIAKKDETKMELIVANDVGRGGMGTPDNDVYIIKSRDDIKHVQGPKKIIAEKIVSKLSEILKDDRVF
ncbi:MAG: bifunctional phosphopantothenoylcysteine decarboxylase/phosphopantothenate--cysteine ligase CoaBC [Candidatus Methanoliparum thermophilum]|uniref:Coenzyme A biosynthesis bifunctional protein CoaBC n=1 Tax=Methanoliparum thermophilum TaxID=2491083 RepID=A0A520KR51_METT2|nr:bifunctional phosphopantothenoylcysteine decarboxylase/phosphopantothenate--cysteine ligase CoaBC [Candidatus Methanoliparum sp. LAM-1]RZN64105.1 MAG: bifunctional phosphopantothenoylcysteine decarboxylase/phosphopantothenate--cysteine ligase CoaBC [Candidatus Methanoliparum thermophilum]BDC35632.1 phosphopantothenoylcysteine decarboxylase [Candidatus Methanoliparum sp. LAM-1]